MAKGLPSMVEVLKKQLTLSESTVQDLREQIHTLQTAIEQLTQENSELKHMLQVITYHFICYTASSIVKFNMYIDILICI